MEIITQAQINKMSTQEIEEKLAICKHKITHMIALDANEIAACVMYENELKLRKGNGDC